MAALIAWLAPATTMRLDVGSPGDRELLRSFFPAERNSIETYRWVGNEARLSLPVSDAGTYRVELAIATVEPEGRTLRLACGSQHRDVPLGDHSGNLTVSLECAAAGEQLPVELAVPVVRLPGDGRPLGVSVRKVSVTPLDTDDRLRFRLAAMAMVAASLLGLTLAAAGLGISRIRYGIPVVAGLLWLGLVLIRPDLFLSTVSGPGGLLILAAGLVAWSLAGGRRWQALAFAALAPVVALAVPQAPVARVLPALWTEADAAAVQLAPWLAVLPVLAAGLIGSRRAAPLAVAGTGAGVLTLALPAVASFGANRWSLAVSVPHWTDHGSVAGALYLGTVFLTAGVSLLVVRRHPGRVLPGVLLPALIVLLPLLAWRAEVMRFNGDEPHYYVTARSIGLDRDLELLNNYHAPEYQEATVSPLGNIAAGRETGTDRYTAFAPADGDAWFLAPRLPDDWTVDQGPGLISTRADPPVVVNEAGEWERLPALRASESLALLLPASCAVDRLWIGAPDGGQRTVDLRLLGREGETRWTHSQQIDGEITAIEFPPDAGPCRADGPGTLAVEAGGGPVVAQAFDTGGGFRVIPGRAPGETHVLAGMPRDRYASPSVGVLILVHNPASETVLATIRILTASDQTMRTISVGIPPGAVRAEQLPVVGAEAVMVTPADSLVVSGVATVLAADYSMPASPPVARWRLPAVQETGRDAGTWLTVANPEPAAMRVLLRDGPVARIVELCGYCAKTSFVSAGDGSRRVEVLGLDDRLFSAGAVEYEERTASLHFDLGLPLLAALPAGLGPPESTLIVPVLAALLMAPGLLVLLRGIGVSPGWAVVGAMASVLLAPMSAYAVRLYTEIVAASLLVWFLVCWQRARHDRWLVVPLILGATGLVFLHGRFAPLAAVAGVLAIVALLDGTRAIVPWRQLPGRRLALVAVAGVIVIGAVVLLSPLAVGLQGRASLDYFGVSWVPINLYGALLDRGSGLLPFAPWVLLGLAVPRPVSPVQRAALAFIVVNVAVVALRAGGWQTWGAPARYLLPVVPLLLLFAVPGLIRLWEHRAGRAGSVLVLLWSVLATFMLHWVPLSGYVQGDRYLIDEVLRDLFSQSPFVVFPTVAPRPGLEWLGIILLVMLTAFLIWTGWPSRLVAARRRPG